MINQYNNNLLEVKNKYTVYTVKVFVPSFDQGEMNTSKGMVSSTIKEITCVWISAFYILLTAHCSM